MPSKIASLLGLSLEQQSALDDTPEKLKSLGEWFVETVDALKEAPLLKVLRPAADVAKEWSGTVKVVAHVIEKWAKEHSPEVLGWLACTLVYRHVAEEVIRQFGPPKSHVLYSGDVVRQRLKKLRLDDPSIMTGFSLGSATGHPFIRAADQALLLILEAAGYDGTERRVMLRSARSIFTVRLQELLSGEGKARFAPFSQWLQLDSDDARLYATLTAHIERQRVELEEQPALGIEPFAINQVYIESECGALRWKTIRDVLKDGKPVDPFDEVSAAREDLMTTVTRLIFDRNYDDCIVIQGAPGAGKSTFTKKLCVRLNEEGFVPLRIPLGSLRVYNREIFDAIQDAITRFAGPGARPFKSEVFREKVFSESVPTEGREISPYVFIFDGWDEINLSADEGFQKRVERLLDSIRYTFLDQNRNTVRVVITGRPSQAIGRSNFLRDETYVLTIRSIQPKQLRTYVTSLSRALETPTFSSENVEGWKLGDLERYESVLAQYEAEFPNVQSLEVLGQPLLVHLALKVMASFKGDLSNLIRPSTTLYRHLTDLTCKRGGKSPTEASVNGSSARIEGRDLRSLLHGTALAITAYGLETIPIEELEFRLETLGVGEIFLVSKHHPLSNLMISFYFKEVTEHSGCEFLHKSFREYLAAEAIIEVLKDYGNRAQPDLAERAIYWRDFTIEDARWLMSRKFGEVFCAQWLSKEIRDHLRELLHWEVDRAVNQEKNQPASKGAGLPTDPLSFEGWERVRDGLSDLWDWWGEGVHLRPQPKQRQRDWHFDESPFVVELVKLAMRRANYGQPTPPRPPRTATVDAHLGYALFLLNCFLHASISEAKGWMDLASRVGAQGLWDGVQARRRYQVAVKHGESTFVQFAPSGESREYFRNYVTRINGAGVAPADIEGNEFPAWTYMRGLFLAGCNLSGLDLNYADLSSSMLDHAILNHAWAFRADFRFASLRESFCYHTFLADADLAGADMAHAVLEGADLSGVDLSGVINLLPEQSELTAKPGKGVRIAREDIQVR